MRWVPLYILAYVMLGLQLGLAPFVQFKGAEPNLVLLCVIFIGLHVPKRPALAASFAIGLVQDMVTAHPLGIYAFSYSVCAFFVLAMRDVVYREHPLTHLTLTFVSGLLVASVLLIHGFVKAPPPVVRPDGSEIAGVRTSTGIVITTAVYTALLSPLVLMPLLRMRRLFSLAPTRRIGRA